MRNVGDFAVQNPIVYLTKLLVLSFDILCRNIHILFYMVFNGYYESLNTEILLREFIINYSFIPHSTFHIRKKEVENEKKINIQNTCSAYGSLPACRLCANDGICR